jgi:hypothetical protein
LTHVNRRTKEPRSPIDRRSPDGGGQQLDARLSDGHEAGVSIAATVVSRETVYRSIERYRAQLGA